MTGFPVLRTSRLILRGLDPGDLEALVHHANNEKITDNILNLPYPFREPDAAMHLSHAVQGFKRKDHFTFVITKNDVGELIGEVGVHLEGNGTAQLGYWVAEPLWGRGIASEALGAIPVFAWELGLRQLYAVVDPENPGSQRVLEKNGFELLATRSRLREYGLRREG